MFLPLNEKKKKFIEVTFKFLRHFNVSLLISIAFELIWTVFWGFGEMQKSKMEAMQN